MASNERDRAKTIIALAIVGMLVLTPVCLLFSYGDWSRLIEFDWQSGLKVFNRWPWIRVSILLTLISTLVAVAGAALDTTQPAQGHGFGMIVGYLLWGILIIVLFLVHPGMQVLGLGSDPNVMVAWLYITVLHGAGVRYIYRHTSVLISEMQQAKKSKD
jgi:hypothetical protein